MLTWMAFTKLADSIVMLPASALCVAWLLVQKAWRTALLWLVLLGGALVLVTASKLAFIGWGIASCTLDFTGISGHAMRATAVMPVLLYLCVSSASRNVRAFAFIAGLLFGLLIGVSRLMLQVHSSSEVISGCLLGGAVSLGFVKVLAEMRRPVLIHPALALGLLVLVPAPMGEAAPTEKWLEQMATTFSGNAVPYRRSDSGWCARNGEKAGD
jgi:membrane-associated phospholipid phosphatase